MDNLYLILSNLFYISLALIPFILLHCFMFYDKMGRKKLIFSVIAAVFLLPVIALYPCYASAFSKYENMKDTFFIGYSLIYIFGYMGIIAFNYFVFLFSKFRQEENKTKIPRFIISFFLLSVIIYLSIPTYISFLSLKTAGNSGLSIKLSEIAYKLSPFPYTKKVLFSFAEK